MLPMQSTDAPAIAAPLADAGADLRYWVAFSHVPGIGPARLGALIERFGSVEAAWHAPASALDGLLDQRSRAAFLATRTESDPDDLLARVTAAGAHAVTWDDPAYPARLRRVPLPPYLLYVRGNPALLDTRAVAVVGTRRASVYGKRAAAEIAGSLAAAGVTIVSGLALGIDAVAHEAALDAGGATVAVLGCGVDVVYPERNRALTGRIAAEGALVSEYPPGRPPDAGNFPARNRIVSGLTLATLVIEAGVKSGALITAGFALEQGGDVFAVPGSIFSPLSEGTNLLIASGAGVARSADDILAALDLTRAAEQNAARRSLPTDPTEATILLHLAAEPMHIDDLARAAGLGSADVARALTMMELKGLVQHTGGMRWVAA